MANHQEAGPSPLERHGVAPPQIWPTLRVVFVLIVVNVGLNAMSVVRNWGELTLVHHVIGITLWFALPLIALFLMWRWSMAARWILVVLFGGRAILEAYAVAEILCTHHALLLASPLAIHAVNALFYGGSAAWLRNASGATADGRQ